LNGELETWLQDKFATACHFAAQRAPLAGLRIGPTLAEWEETYLLAAWRDDLFAINERGIVESELLRAGEEAGTEERSYRVFSVNPPRLLRENLCQLATAARLIYERGWLKSHIALESGQPEHRASADSFDLLVRPAEGLLIWVEVRRTGVELEKLVADLRACSRRGPHAQHDCGFPQNHPRYEFCLARRPAYLWVVAPDAEFCFQVSYEPGSIELEGLPALPARSMLELG